MAKISSQVSLNFFTKKPLLKKARPGVRIILRGDAGFFLPEILKVCERSGVKYAFGFSSNAVLKRKISDLLELGRIQYFRTGEKARLFAVRPRVGKRRKGMLTKRDDVYYAAGTWNEPRRMIVKAEWLEKGANPRFVVTNLETEAQELYDNFYVQRGASSEHRIKELKLGIQADRLSCQKFIVNQFRLSWCKVRKGLFSRHGWAKNYGAMAESNCASDD